MGTRITFIGQTRESFIDYVLCNTLGMDDIESVSIEHMTGSDHLPITTTLKIESTVRVKEREKMKTYDKNI